MSTQELINHALFVMKASRKEMYEMKNTIFIIGDVICSEILFGTNIRLKKWTSNDKGYSVERTGRHDVHDRPLAYPILFCGDFDNFRGKNNFEPIKLESFDCDPISKLLDMINISCPRNILAQTNISQPIDPIKMCNFELLTLSQYKQTIDICIIGTDHYLRVSYKNKTGYHIPDLSLSGYGLEPTTNDYLQKIKNFNLLFGPYLTDSKSARK